MATGPDLRIGDTDREAAAASLREHFAQGRLTLEEFNDRLDAAFAATRQSHLQRIVGDLPHVTTRPAPLPSAAVRPCRDHSRHEHRNGSRPRPRALATLLAVVATWLIMVFLVLPDTSIGGFPVIGKLGIIFAIFAIVRGLLRRIMGARH